MRQEAPRLGRFRLGMSKDWFRTKFWIRGISDIICYNAAKL